MPESESPSPPAIKDERSHFLAHMGHDLRAPMTNILALTEALVDGVYGPMAAAQTETLKHIRDNGHRMINMVTDLVDLARFETGQIKLEPIPCEIMEPCRGGIDMARGMAKSKKVTITSELTPPALTAVADARRLRQLMSGLATGAVVWAPADGQVQIQIKSQPAQGWLRMEILVSRHGDKTFPSDNSSRDAATAAVTLQRFRKMSSVAVTMVEKLVLMHEGQLEVIDLGTGSIAIGVNLPLVFPDYVETSAAATVDAGAAQAAKAGGMAPFILLADDEEIIRTITQDYLESTGYRVSCVTNGREALEFLQKEAPDLIIMDMQMPVLDGMEALVQLRRSTDPRISKTPVISLSGLATPGHRERCLAAGANGCLAKPFGIKDLERVIKETLGAGN